MLREVSCVLVDDHPAVCDAVSRCLQAAGVRVVGTSPRGDLAAAVVEESQPDVVVVDLVLPGRPGMSVARDMTRAGRNVVIYAGRVDLCDFEAALGFGVRGFVLKHSPLEDIGRAIHAVHRGDSFIDQSLHHYLEEGCTSAHALSARELEVLQLASDGLSVRDIANRLHLSASTVRTHTASVEKKLAANDRTHAVALALRQALIS
jgi:DNA-binding NarL/FixJ family response regulator